MTFAEKLKALRNQAGLTQAALAARSGLSLGVVHDYEQGKREPTLRSAFKLAGVLKAPLEDLAECLAEEEPARKVRRPRTTAARRPGSSRPRQRKK